MSDKSPGDEFRNSLRKSAWCKLGRMVDVGRKLIICPENVCRMKTLKNLNIARHGIKANKLANINCIMETFFYVVCIYSALGIIPAFDSSLFMSLKRSGK